MSWILCAVQMVIAIDTCLRLLPRLHEREQSLLVVQFRLLVRNGFDRSLHSERIRSIVKSRIPCVYQEICSFQSAWLNRTKSILSFLVLFPLYKLTVDKCRFVLKGIPQDVRLWNKKMESWFRIQVTSASIVRSKPFKPSISTVEIHIHTISFLFFFSKLNENFKLFAHSITNSIKIFFWELIR